MRRRYIMHNGELVEVTADYVQQRDARTSHNVIPDIDPYRSMIDGSVITSRSKHRTHLKDHGCLEVGNDSSALNPRPKPFASPPVLKEAIAREVYRKLRY